MVKDPCSCRIPTLTDNSRQTEPVTEPVTEPLPSPYNGVRKYTCQVDYVEVRQLTARLPELPELPEHEAFMVLSDLAQAQAPEGVTTRVHSIVQIEGPWLDRVIWLDPLCMDTRDVVTARPSKGNRIDDSGADLISSRLESLGLMVIDRWGVGDSGVMFKCTGRIDGARFTYMERLLLEAPRDHDPEVAL